MELQGTIQSLPPEILQFIFLYNALEPWSIRWTRWESFRRTLALSHVCRQWRSIVKGMHELWKKFALIPPPRGEDDGRKAYWKKCPGIPPSPKRVSNTKSSRDKETLDFNAEMMKLCCDSNKLEVGWEAWRLGAASPEALSSTLFLYGHRIWELDLLLDERDRDPDEPLPEYDNEPILDAIRGCSSKSLRNLSISYWHRTDAHKALQVVVSEPVIKSELIFGGELSQLKKLDLFMVWFDLETHEIGPNLESLSLHLTFPNIFNVQYNQNDTFPATMERWVHILPRLPNLTHLRLLLILEARDDPSPPLPCLPDISHERLAHVHLDIDIRNLNIFLTHIFLPACRTLRLYLAFKDTEGFSTCIEDTVHRYSHLPLIRGARVTMYYRCTTNSGFGCGLVREGDRNAQGVSVPVSRSRAGTEGPNLVGLLPELQDLLIFIDGGRAGKEVINEARSRSFLKGWRTVLERTGTLAVVCYDYPEFSRGHSHIPSTCLAPIREVVKAGYGGLLKKLVCNEGAVKDIVGDSVREGLSVKSLAYPSLELVTLEDIDTAQTCSPMTSIIGPRRSSQDTP
ncbi:hypothetical protein FA13DRAFT_299275 [Coprinellus micaceus]|uniref:F-box domain-containing protein n=1 Tax=Coprinellus micaceus TaxID=71717 RepID=A0A4Y7SE97_COPMI|nr:hypothetical protein FA13DRAFT_299275 [Coprinellus micaceus]